MELDWSTFLLEIINFLILIWILKRFLYKPVLDVIARRRADIKNRLDEARNLHKEANTLKKEYENRLSDWGQEREQARDALAQEINEERARRMEALKKDLAQEREKEQIAESRRHAETRRAIEHHALQQSAQFAARLLAQATGPELETRLLDLLLDGLSHLSNDQMTALKTQGGTRPEAIMITSAYPLSADRQQCLKKTLADVTGLTAPVKYEQDPDLLAGLRITIGAWVLHANVRDELKGFAEFAYVAR